MRGLDGRNPSEQICPVGEPDRQGTPGFKDQRSKSLPASDIAVLLEHNRPYLTPSDIDIRHVLLGLTSTRLAQRCSGFV